MVREAHIQHVRPPRRRVRHAGFLVGLGSAALLEDALFRRSLGLHDLVEPGPSPTAEGVFLLGALGIVLAGVWLLHAARARLAEPASGRVLLGSALAGAGAYALAEGILLHALLARHSLVEGPRALAWDLGWLAGGILLLAAGVRLLVLASRARRDERRREPRRGVSRVP